jgi:hypothetical protein
MDHVHLTDRASLCTVLVMRDGRFLNHVFDRDDFLPLPVNVPDWYTEHDAVEFMQWNEHEFKYFPLTRFAIELLKLHLSSPDSRMAAYFMASQPCA